ncbi:MAG: hypothetical protein AB1384_12525 [Actinomycetota bacterium]
MFRGSIPAPLRSMTQEIVKGWDCSDVWVGCSGNFTVERVLWPLDRFRLHGNDVTIYSCVIGEWLASMGVDLRLRPEVMDSYGWLELYLDGEEESIATLLLATRLPVNREGDNAYYKRIYEGHKRQWDSLHTKTLDRVRAFSMRLSSFYSGDVREYVKQVPTDQGLIAFPPFVKGDYERMFRGLEALFEWEPPDFSDVAEHREELIADIMSKRFWEVCVNFEIEELSDHLVGITQTTNRGVKVYVYASDGPARICVPNQDTEEVLVERLGPGDEVGSEIALLPFTAPQFAALRSEYMNAYIRPGQASLACGVLVDGMLVGVFAYSTAPTMAHWEGRVQTPHAYLLSDFPVEPSDYKHLAKLVLYASLSKEVKLMLERYARHRIRSAITTAFTDRPVSMKYRGLFELLSRKEQEHKDYEDLTDAYYGQRYELNYGAVLGEWTLAEGLAMWKKKYAGKREADGDKD